jgi:hypothetical protein
MWDQVTVPFARLLGSKLYPTLFGNREYQRFLNHCGITPPYPDDVAKLTPAQRTQLSQNADLQANLLSLDLNSLQALKQARAAAVEITGPHPIYRLYNSDREGSHLRFFWFSEDLLMQSYHAAGGSKKNRLEWLRGQSAVAYNWSLCDRVARLRLRPQDTLIGVKANGLPIRGVEIRKGESSIDYFPVDYYTNYKKYSAMLPGGAPQLFLYQLPTDRVEPYW